MIKVVMAVMAVMMMIEYDDKARVRTTVVKLVFTVRVYRVQQVSVLLSALIICGSVKQTEVYLHIIRI